MAENTGTIATYSVDEVEDFLLDEGIPSEVTETFARNEIDGAAFIQLTESDLQQLCPIIGRRTKIRAILERVRYFLSHVG